MARRSGPALEVLVDLDRRAPEALHLQLERQLRDAIREGRLRAGSGLPSSRTLASDLGIARAVVVDVYAQLAAEGYLQATRGSRTSVAARAPASETHGSVEAPPAPADCDFHPGMPDLGAFPMLEWGQCAQDALRAAPHAALGYADPQGAPPLREVLAGYLGRVRGAIADPDRIVICAGLTQGLALTCRALRAQGVRKIAVEDPCFRAHREIISHAGLTAEPVAVDEDGIRVDRLAGRSVGAVLVAPAHQFPTGYALSGERRAALLDWATKAGAIVIEDDHDGHLRYDGRPIGALQALAPERVVYAGTASKILAPGLRLGWLVLPRAMVEPVRREKARDDLVSNVPTQLTLGRFIEDGHLDRHLRRVRRTYDVRRRALIDALTIHLPAARVEGIAAGLHTLVLLAPEVSEAALCERASARGVALYGLAPHRADAAPTSPGLVLGFAGLPEAKITRGIEAVAEDYRRLCATG
jgi:GntR family transcriptional regulator/MocR family aminotransferase